MQTNAYYANDHARKASLKLLRSHSRTNRILTLLMFASLVWLLAVVWMVPSRMGGVRSAAALPGPGGGSVATLVTVCLTALLGFLPLGIILFLKRVCVDAIIMNRSLESITLEEHGLRQVYAFRQENRRMERSELRLRSIFMDYGDITRIEYFQQEQAAKIHGKVYYLRDNALPDDDNIIKAYDHPRIAFRVVFPYYGDVAALCQALSGHAGIPVTTTAACKESLHEKLYKGVG